MMNKKESLDELKFMIGTDRGKGKVKFTLEHAIKAQKGSRCMALLFKLSAARWWVVNTIP
jgi:hypothetical protein